MRELILKNALYTFEIDYCTFHHGYQKHLNRIPTSSSTEFVEDPLNRIRTRCPSSKGNIDQNLNEIVRSDSADK